MRYSFYTRGRKPDLGYLVHPVQKQDCSVLPLQVGSQDREVIAQGSVPHVSQLLADELPQSFVAEQASGSIVAQDDAHREEAGKLPGLS